MTLSSGGCYPAAGSESGVWDTRLRKIGLIYNDKDRSWKALAQALKEKLAGAYDCWVLPSAEEGEAREVAPGTQVIISIGGDGTVLRVARIAVLLEIPILGVNMGRVGFMTEINGADALEKVPQYLASEGRVEERAMLDVELLPAEAAEGATSQLRALNEVAVVRGSVPRVCDIEARIDGALLTTYRADGVILATATGSTSYALASGGPVVHPQSTDFLLVPVSAHLSFSSPLVISPDSVVELRLISEYPGLVSVDGQLDQPLQRGDTVRARRSERVARFLRASPPSAFYATLTERLNPRAAE